jgi:hypothetical protein
MAATAAIAVQLAGAGMSAFGQLKAGRAQDRLAKLNAESILETSELNAQLIEEGSETNAQIAEYNARMLEAKARDAVRRGFEDESRFRVDLRGLIGSQRAGYAGQGVDVSEGSPLDVQTDTAYQGELDALTIRTNAAREAWGFNVSAEDERMQAAAQRKLGKLQASSTRKVGRSEALSTRLSGQYARSAGNFGAASTLLGSAGSLLYQQYGFKKKTGGK